MPQNKRESLIYTIIMCFIMVLWMSIYNVSLQMKGISIDVLQAAWIGFPIACIYALVFDWFIVAGPAKKIAFKFFAKPTSSKTVKIIAVSCCMVVPMVIVMSLYGSLEACMHTQDWGKLPIIWLTNIPKNIIMALPFQLLIAGPLARKLFRSAFPEGKILA